MNLKCPPGWQLRIRWELGPSPVRDVHRSLAETKDTNYSTTVKMLSVMLDKGLVLRGYPLLELTDRGPEDVFYLLLTYKNILQWKFFTNRCLD